MPARLIDDALLNRLTAHIRAGASPQAAAEACDLTFEHFQALMRIRRFRKAVRLAAAEVKVAVEVKFREKDPQGWLDQPRGEFRGENYLPEHLRQKENSVHLYSRGAKGVAIRDVRTRRLASTYRKAFPWLEAADTVLLRTFVQVSLLADEIYSKITKEGVTRPTGQPHPLLGEFRNYSRTAADLAGRLGLSPRDRAQMKANSTTAALDTIDLDRINKVLDHGHERELESVEPAALDGGSGDQSSED
jgi:hypothetical protein